MKLRFFIPSSVLLSITAITLCFISPVFAQESKSTATKKINAWYNDHPDNYSISINNNNASAKVTRYHPKRKDEKNTLIQITYEGMKITLGFTKPLDVISTHLDSLQKYLSDVSVEYIYSDIECNGWNIHPETPSSSLRGKGVRFTAGGDSLSLSINWSTYTVMGYRDSEKCNEERGMMDIGISDSCYVTVDKILPLEILINQVPINKD